MTQISSMSQVEKLYDELLKSPCLEFDPWSKPDLYVYRPRRLLMAKAIEDFLPNRSAIADIGCGNGFFLRLSAELGFEKFVAVDYFPLEPERSFLTEMSGVTFLQKNFNQSGFLSDLPDSSLDCVVSTEVFEHLYHHPVGYLQECWRVLRPGGLLLLSTPNPTHIMNAVRLLLGKSICWGAVAFAETPKLTAENKPLAVWDIHFWEYTPDELQTIVSKLEGANILRKGFVATDLEPTSSFGKRIAKKIQWSLGLGYWRLLSLTQYMIIRCEKK